MKPIRNRKERGPLPLLGMNTIVGTIAYPKSMAKEEGQPTITDNMPLFEWGKDEVIEDDPEYSEILSGDDIEQLSPIISQITEEDGHGW